MLSRKTLARMILDHRTAWLIWVIGTIIAWVYVQYAGLALTETSRGIRTWIDTAYLARALGLNGAVLGVVISIVQAPLVQAWFGGARRWFAATFLGYVVGLPVGFLMSVVALWASARSYAPDLLSTNTSAILFFPTFLTMVFDGAMVASIQCLIFLRHLGQLNGRALLLWVGGTALIWALGYLVCNTTWTHQLPFAVRLGIAGGTIAILTGVLLQFLQRHLSLRSGQRQPLAKR
jgi:hypothetical protein